MARSERAAQPSIIPACMPCQRCRLCGGDAAVQNSRSTGSTGEQRRGLRTRAARQAAAVARLLLHVADDGTLGHVTHLNTRTQMMNKSDQGNGQQAELQMMVPSGMSPPDE